MMNPATKLLVSFAFVLAAAASAAQERTQVQFYTPTIVRIVKGGPAPAESFAVTARPQEVP
ncbi:MAG: hypothetical protein J5951_05540, partial [Bacteroidales bacterium]|nr:hypothetical protein [Bacteroidales bacterium]